MSYGKFLDACERQIKWRKQNNLPPQNWDEEAADVRDQWIAAGMLKELIAFVLHNWDSGNGEEFWKPILDHLLRNHETALVKRLWKGILGHRLRSLWWIVDFQKQNFPNTTLQQIVSTSLKNFNQFSSKESWVRRLAWERQFALEGINEFRTALRALGEEKDAEKLEGLVLSVSNLQKPAPQPSSDKRKMDETLFWQLIHECRKNSSDDLEFIDRLRFALEKLYPKELLKFEKLLLQKTDELYTWDHWALAFIARRGCGDDEFDYFRAWVISKGKNAFEIIKSLDCNQLPLLFDGDPQLEELLYLAEDIYEGKTSDLMPPARIKAPKLSGKKWNEETLPSSHPSLCKIFSYG